MSAAEPDLLGLYLKQIGKTPLLSAADEVDLARRIEAGLYAGHLIERGADTSELQLVVRDGRRAKDKLIRSNLRQAIERGIHDKSRTVRLPIHVAEELSRLLRIGRQLAADLGREPTDGELAASAELSRAQVAALRRAGQEMISLDIPVGELGEGRIGDMIADEDGLEVQELTERRAMSADVQHVVTSLPPREAFVIRLRYGLTGQQAQSYTEIAARLGLTRERIRQLERQALKRLRQDGPLLAWAS
ncbi:RNA polymerase subunit sigma [Nonomuraea sp. WAC 01424]|uniref:sigma-70 family RNA polymerase sigma factor n=1 Tax=Nonomuraea sp. WAC 01424 TaxID=2203200 RepID=UPI000F778D17|nr:sigma-70 family RNA polymerase sigma factor [Nonomuraea sp. WAC 01424]RSN07393.1 RNA polymerase subunit sigma [Nonomuraea sp. WAC 01424]